MRRLTTLIAVVGLSISPVLLAQNETLSRKPAPTGRETQSAAIRAARDALFEPQVEGLRPLAQEKPGTPPRVTERLMLPMSELPVREADTIVVGSVKGLTPHVVPSGKGIYTEYHVEVDAMLKSATARKPGAKIDLATLGGAVQLPDGRGVQHVTQGIGKQIEPGGRYLFFLNDQPSAECYYIVKAWELRDGQAVATSEDDVTRVLKGASEFHGRSEASLIQAVRDTVVR